jgi:hypothetical protein
MALEGVRRGLGVLGDDMVVVDVPGALVWPLPRPLKRRVSGDQDRTANDALRATLGGEAIALAPRRNSSALDVNRGYPLGRVVHLARHAGPGVIVADLTKTDAVRLNLDQLRGRPPHFVLAHAAAAARMLSNVPNVRMSVGDDEVGPALSVALDVS